MLWTCAANGGKQMATKSSGLHTIQQIERNEEGQQCHG